MRVLQVIGLLVLFLGIRSASAQKPVTLETAHYRIIYEKKHQALAGEILRIAESVWPTLARAYDAYDRYERIDIMITDDSDHANGWAMYTWATVAIYAPHMDWVMRNRQNWLGNVVTHELAHVFTLRRAGILTPIDYAMVSGATYSPRERIDYRFSFPWVPLIAPTWYVEGIAQFEAEQNGNDNWDSQRDMVVRDAWLTGTLPSLDYIETFDPFEDWIQAERVYNTGYAFLRYLRDRYGADKVRDLADPKPLTNFSTSVASAFGKSLPELFEEWKRSLAAKYGDFKSLPADKLADPDMVGRYHQNLAISSDGRYMAWLGNDESRRFPANWIYWKDLKKDKVHKSKSPTSPAAEPPKEGGMGPLPSLDPPRPTDIQRMRMIRSGNPMQDIGKRYLSLTPANPNTLSPARAVAENHRHLGRSDEMGSHGLEFNRDNTRLLTTRQSEDAQFTDIFEYHFRKDVWEKDKWKRLTWEERAAYPSYHPTKDLVVFTRKKGGSQNVGVLDSTGKTVTLTNFSNGEQVFNPRYTPKGDSIYFTLGIGEEEAIVAINADAPNFDVFATLKDSIEYPDSLNLSKKEKFTFVTPMRKGAIRNLRFAGDTLLWSSNMDSAQPVYNVYARLPRDSGLFRATQVRGQALEPLVHDGNLYYQAYQKQRFLIAKQPLALTRVSSMARPADSLPLSKGKKIDYSKAFESGEPYSKLAVDVVPFISVEPQFLSSDEAFTDIAGGLAINFGSNHGGWYSSVFGAVAKRFDLRRPLNYRLGYSGAVMGPFNIPVPLYYSLYYDIVQDNFTEPINAVQGPYTLRGGTKYSLSYNRLIMNSAVPLPLNFWVDGRMFRQAETFRITEKFRATAPALGDTVDVVTDTLYLHNDLDHIHFTTALNWGYAWGKLGAFLPTWGGFALSTRKWWATYADGSRQADSSLQASRADQHDPATYAVLEYDRFDPWSADLWAGGALSLGRAVTFFANLETGTFLNKFPMDRRQTGITASGDTLIKENTKSYLWVLPYQIGYYRLQGYPYNFVYGGRDIMEGTWFAFGQAGFQLPLRFGGFLPVLPTSSFKGLMLTGFVEGGTTLIRPADKIYRTLEEGRHNLLLDYGARISANFQLYHRIPLSAYFQVFMPYNELSADGLSGGVFLDRGTADPSDDVWSGSDYQHSLDASGNYTRDASLDRRDREEYIEIVKVPRFRLGLELGFQ